MTNLDYTIPTTYICLNVYLNLSVNTKILGLICPLQNYLRATSGSYHASRNRKSGLGPVFPTIYNFELIYFSDTLISHGYFQIFLTDEGNLNASKIDPSPQLIVSVPNRDK